MKSPMLIVVFLLISLGGGAVAQLLFSDPAPKPDTSGLEAQLNIEREVAALRDDMSEISRSLLGLEARLGSQQEPQQMPEAQLRAMVDEIVAARLSQADVASLVPAEGPAEPAPTVEDLLGRLDDVSGELERELLWQEIRDAGMMDAVLAYLEDAVAADPSNEELAMALGVAYLEKITEVGNGPMAGIYATKADETFNELLAANPQNWDARFTKAMALTFWPPVFGKQGEAIKQFEVLTEQQRGMPYTEYHGETWLALGNMYQQLGEADKATDAWIEGYELYPEHQGLQGKFVDDP